MMRLKIFLFLLFFVSKSQFAQQLVINEVSQGPTGAKEYVELLVVGTPTCNAIPCMDLRNYIIDDNNGNHATGAGVGIAAGCVRLQNIPFWQCIPYGTIIVFYNDADLNASIPAQDLSMTDGNCRLVIPISNCTLLERHTTLPSTVLPAYPTTGFVGCGNWTQISMANGDDSFQTINAAGALVHSVSWNNNTLATIIYFAGAAGGNVAIMTNALNNNPATQANWVMLPVAGNETPGSPNNAANAAWISSMNNGCLPLLPLTTTVSSTNAGCSCNGSATVVASGAIGPYTYTWFPTGGNSSTASGLCAGIYTVSATSSNGCVETKTVNIVSAGSVSVTTATTSVTCNGFANGSATATPSGGTGPYTFTWSPSGGNAFAATGLTPGTYTVIAADANNCTVTATAIITQPATALTAITSATNILCFGAANGSASVTASGGTAGYTYTWSPSGGNTTLASPLTAGNYTVLVKDVNNCTITATAIITQPATALTAVTSATNILCFGAANGSASVTASGGTAGYTYTWSPSGGNTTLASPLTAGNYTVLVKDVNNCTVTAAAIITQPATALTAITSATNILCFGAANGSASVTASGGTAGYTYTWSPTGGNTTLASPLTAGNYTVLVKDVNNCTVTATAIITQPATALTAITSATNILCFGAANGSASVTASGGTAGYTYTWSPTGGNTTLASPLTAGNYTVLVKDVNNCTVTAAAIITQPASALNGVINFSNTNCTGSIGSATVAGNGGTGPYTYTWLPTGGNTSIASGLGAGVYSVTINDANNCIATATVAIQSGNGGLTALISGTNVLCNGLSTGAASVSPSSTTPGYTYSWSPSGGNAALATSLPAGTYSVLITNTTCVSSGIELVSNGNFNAGNTGFSSSYIYTPPPNTAASQYYIAQASQVVVWNGGMFSTGDHTSGSGNFMMVNGSGTPGTNVFCQNIPVNPNTNYNFSTWVSSLNTGNQAQLQFYVNGIPLGVVFTAPPTINNWIQFFSVWNSGASSSANICIVNQNSATGGNDFGLDDISFQECLAPCPITKTISITQPAAVAGIISPTNVLCFGGSTGAASVTASGGTAPYSYTWSPSGGNASSANGLSNGNYTVIINDANNCTVTANSSITQPASALGGITSATNALCLGAANGAASVTPSGGTAGYTYTWSPSGGNTNLATLLTAGNYTVLVADANNCTVNATAIITQPPALTATTTASNILCFGAANGSASVTALGGTGGYTYTWSPLGGNTSITSLLTAGNYTVLIADANNCTVSATAIITQPAIALTAIPTITNVLCFGGSNGSASVTASGGTAGYTYTWSPLGGNATLTSLLAAGNYTVLVADANNCTVSATAIITQPATPLTAATSATNVLCFGAVNGAASITASGGTPGYTYTWSPTGGTNSVANNLAPGNYTIEVKDINNCTVNTFTTISQPTAALGASVISSNVNCNGASNGSSTVTASGGTAGYSFTWLPSLASSSLNTGLSAGTHTAFIVDANNCTFSLTTTISQPSPITLNVNSIKVCDGQSGVLLGNVNGGTAPYSYTWNNTPGSFSVAVSTTATVIYTLSVTDANGCNSPIDTAMINVYPPLTLSISPTKTICAGTSSGLSANASGGNGMYQYNWLPNNIAGQIISVNLNNTTVYTVTVIDGCSQPAIATTTIFVETVPTPTLLANKYTGCSPVCVSFTNTAFSSSLGIQNSTWTFSDGNFANGQQPNHCFTNKGAYTATNSFTTTSGCKMTVQLTNYINVFQKPDAEFSASNYLFENSNPEVNFYNNSSNAINYFWDFSGMGSSTLVNPVYSFNEPGKYLVTLIATNDFCSDTVYKIVECLPAFTFYAPNTFTPNNDKRNDFFYPLGEGWDVKTYNLTVFDRWGEKIYETDQVDGWWDGTYKGVEVKEDTYIWKASLKDIFRKQHNYIGHITVIR